MEGNSEQVVFVVTMERIYAGGLTYLFQSMNLRVEVFSAATAFLKSKHPNIGQLSCARHSGTGRERSGVSGRPGQGGHSSDRLHDWTWRHFRCR